MSYYSQGYAKVYDGSYADSIKKRTFSNKQYTGFEALCIVKVDKTTSENHFAYYICCIDKEYYEEHPITMNPSNTPAVNFTNYISNTNSKFYTVLDLTSKDNDYIAPHYNDLVNTNSWVSLFSTTAWKDENHYIDSTDLPIFTLTNSDVSAWENYINTGDDSGADNYSDLHPSQVRIDIWLDGKYPNMQVKPTMEEGEYNDEMIEIQVTASPTLSPTITLSGVLNYDSLTEYSYSQYQHQLPIVPTHYEVRIRWDNHSYCYGDFYIKANGEVLSTDDAETDYIIISFHEGSPDDGNEYPEDDTNFRTNPTTNDYSGTNTLTKTYELNDVTLKQFGNFMWSSNFKDNVLALVQSPIENIVSLKAMPLSGEGSNSEEIKVGNVLSGINAPVVNNADKIETSVVNGSRNYVYIPRVFENFIDYSQISIKLYLPFIGFKEIDPVAVMGKKLYLKYIWDCVLGNVMAVLWLQSDNGSMLLYECWQGSAGIDIAITSTNRGQIESGYVTNGISAVADLFSGNLAGVTRDVFSGLTQEFHSTSNGVGNPSLLGKMDMTARVIIKRPQKFVPKNYGHTVGFPCHQYKTLEDCTDSNHNKFVKCKNFICSQIYDATDEEKEEIKRLMESGVYI